MLVGLAAVIFENKVLVNSNRVKMTVPPKNKGNVAAFSQSSIRSLDRSDVMMLKSALAMVLLKKKYQLKHRCSRGGNDAENNKLTSTFLLSRPTSSRKLLQYFHRDHLDHLFRVACQESSLSSSSSSLAKITGIASHLVEQLDSWATELLGREGANHQVSLERKIEPLHNWIKWSLLSHSGAAKVHMVMMQQVQCNTMDFNESRHHKTILMDCWWEVLVQMISDLYHDDEATAEWGATTQNGCSLDAMAVTLLDLLQALCRGANLQAPELLHDLIFPFCTPNGLSVMYSSLAGNRTTVVQSSFAIGDDEHTKSTQRRLGLTAGAKIMLRIGLYRIFVYNDQALGEEPLYDIEQGSGGTTAS